MTEKPSSRPAVLSVAAERALAQIRNAVLTHAGYDVIPAYSLEAALAALRDRCVNAMVIAHTVCPGDLRTLVQEAHHRNVPLLLLDPYDQFAQDQSELHVNPLDGPEVFLHAIAALIAKDQPPSFTPGHSC
jgi:DNA-binding NtrC family response regulator